MFSKIIFVLTLFISNKICCSQVIQFGKCKEVETMKYFDIERFLGKWFEIQRFPAWYEDYGQCAYKRIQVCGRRIEIEHAFVRNNIQFVLHVNSSYSPGGAAVFEFERNNIDPLGIPLSVITTDYDNYAVVYGCKENTILDIKYISAWILSRESTISEEIKAKALQELNSLPYASAAYLQSVHQVEETCAFHWTAHVHAVNKDNTDDLD